MVLFQPGTAAQGPLKERIDGAKGKNVACKVLLMTAFPPKEKWEGNSAVFESFERMLDHLVQVLKLSLEV